MEVPANRRIKTPEQKKEEIDILKKEMEEVQRIFENTFSTDSGMKALQHIVKMCNVFGTSMSSDSDGKISIEKTFYKDGKKDVALTILSYLPRNIVIKSLGIK